MAQLITIKLTSAGPNLGPFQIWDDFGNLILDEVPNKTMKQGITLSFGDDVNVVVIKSIGRVLVTKHFPIGAFDKITYSNATFKEKGNACLWRHVDTPLLYNNFYGNIEPYILEYPFSSQYFDEILHSVQDYTKVYQYFRSGEHTWEDFSKIEVDDGWFNKAILYNGQQNSGVLSLVPKPLNNLQAYGLYPIFGPKEKIITYTKNDNFYQYNTFWNIVKDIKKAQFITSCESMSIDKHLDQDNMDYSQLSHKKAQLRAKELKVRHILDDRSDIHLVSQFILVSQQISHK